MKRVATAFIVFTVWALFARPIWAHSIRGGFGGGSSFGHRGGSHFSSGSSQWSGFQRGFGRQGLLLGSGNFPLQPRGWGMSRFHHFPHGQFFALPPHFGQGGFAFHSFGFSSGGFAFDNRFGPAGPPPFGAPGPPPLGAPGPLPFVPLRPPPVVISSPFFCFPHGLGFTDQALFLDHLQQFHGIPPKNAFSSCIPVGGGLRWIFLGF